MKKVFLLAIMTVLMTANAIAQQFDLSAVVRPRYENKHGYKSLIGTNVDGSNFISQRTRLNFKYKSSSMKVFVSLQNVRVWGDVSTLSAADTNNALHEAWAEVPLSDKVSFKMGRQEIVYDDHRIFGSVGWAQQARSHDAFLIKFKPNENTKIDLGFALNADGQDGVDAPYSGAAGYKTFQYAWYHGKFNKVGLSFLLLNTGFEYIASPSGNQEIAYMQTIGPRLTYKSGKFSANGALYFQTGKAPALLNTIDVSSLYYAANLGYKVSDTFKVGAGLEYLSGKDDNDMTAEINSFAPLFGTNHKFNGWMDYFYVGNHGGNVGLTDISLTFAYKKDKFSAKLIPHFFSAAADVYNGGTLQSASLGTEIDFTLGYKINKDVMFNAGFSKMLATDTMQVLKGGDKNENNSWAWLMFTFKPTLFSHTKEAK